MPGAPGPGGHPGHPGPRHRRAVGDGDQLLLYTDGVSEARDATGRFFPLAQVTAEAAGRGGGALLDALVTRLEEHVGDRGCDDVLLLVTMC